MLNVLSVTAGLLLIFSCGGSGENSTAPNFSQPLNSSSTASKETLIDIKSMYEGKGTGRFTSVILAPVNFAEAEKGQSVFLSKCISCHTLNSDRIIGPGMKGVTKIRTPEWILNMIVNPEEMTRKDPLAKALMKEFKSVMPYQTISDEEAKQLLDFLRENDDK